AWLSRAMCLTLGSFRGGHQGSDRNGTDISRKSFGVKGLKVMACLARVRVTTSLHRKEAIHGSCYPHASRPPSPAAAPAAAPGPRSSLRRRPPRRVGAAGPPRGGRPLPRPPLLSPGDPLGLP